MERVLIQVLGTKEPAGTGLDWITIAQIEFSEGEDVRERVKKAIQDSGYPMVQNAARLKFGKQAKMVLLDL